MPCLRHENEFTTEPRNGFCCTEFQLTVVVELSNPPVPMESVFPALGSSCRIAVRGHGIQF